VSIETRKLTTQRGDHIVLTLFDDGSSEASILISIDDADRNVVPTAELTLREVGLLRDELRRLAELVVRR
jgi:hypothetical protein